MENRRTGRHTAARKGRTVSSAVHHRSGGPGHLPLKERLLLLRMVVCCGVFVFLVAVKLLLPGKMAEVRQKLSDVMTHSMDVQAVFSAVGDLFTQEGAPEETARALYRSVFQPETGAAQQTAVLQEMPSTALTELRNWRQDETLMIPPADGETDHTAELILYSDEDLPGQVSLQQAILGFDHETPVKGTLSSGFGYRAHPTEGTERFHYGIDLAADSGTAIGCFADGTVAAVGESSSYGNYCTVTHANGCTTLYAHCSRISVSSGAAVKMGEKIGEVGETGMATGPHLHFELQKEGVYLDPIYYVEPA